jgi:transposase
MVDELRGGAVIFVGDDWAEAHHDVCVLDEQGERLAKRRVPEGLAGIGQLHALLAEHASEPGEVVVGIESDRGLWVAALLEAGYVVYAINPLAASRYRDRHTPSRAPRAIRATPRCWPIWCAPIVTSIGPWRLIARLLRL